MPQTVEISDTNWIFVSLGTVEHHFDVKYKNSFRGNSSPFSPFALSDNFFFY